MQNINLLFEKQVRSNDKESFRLPLGSAASRTPGVLL